MGFSKKYPYPHRWGNGTFMGSFFQKSWISMGGALLRGRAHLQKWPKTWISKGCQGKNRTNPDGCITIFGHPRGSGIFYEVGILNIGWYQFFSGRAQLQYNFSLNFELFIVVVFFELFSISGFAISSIINQKEILANFNQTIIKMFTSLMISYFSSILEWGC